MRQNVATPQFNTVFSQQQYAVSGWAHATMRQSSATGKQQQSPTSFVTAARVSSSTSGCFFIPLSQTWTIKTNI